MSDLVLVDRPQPHTTVLTLNRPERLNAMSIDLVIALHDALNAANDDNDCYVVVLTGAGRGFCSGLDLKDFGVVPNIDGLQVGRIAQRSMRAYSRLIPQIRRMHQPVICAVNGPSYGGGMCLTLAAELRIASESATFNSTGIVNGLTSTELGVSWLLPRLIGAAHSNDILLTGRTVDAADALRMGIVNHVVPADQAFDKGMSIARTMAKASERSVRLTKRAVNAQYEAMGFSGAMRAALDTDVLLNAGSSPEKREFARIRKEQGVKAALAWRDARFK